MGPSMDLFKSNFLKFFRIIFFLLGFFSYYVLAKIFFYPLKFIFNCFYSGWKSVSIKIVTQPFFVLFPAYIKGGKYMKIGGNFRASREFRIEAWDKYLGDTFHPQIIIGNNVSFSDNCHIGAVNSVVIQDNVLVGSNVYITDHFHGRSDSIYENLAPILRPLYSKGGVLIGSNVWIGDGVKIMPNVTIGHSSIVGANSVVTKSFPPYSIIAGSPAKDIK